MDEVSCSVQCFSGQPCVVDVLEGGEGGTNDLLSCSYYALQGLMAGRGVSSIPHSYAAGEDALSGAMVEGAHDGDWGFGSSQFVEEVEALLSFLGQ